MTGSDEASSKDSFLSKVTRRIDNGEDDGTDWYDELFNLNP